jgi:hypothetical protein
MTDPNFYRFYECNLDCYKLKAEKEFRCPKCELGDATATSVTTNELILSPGYIHTYTGLSPLGTTHTITSTQLPLLANRSMNGDITFYLNNDVYVNVTMGAVVKAANTVLQTLLYQRVGNFTSVDFSTSGGNLVLTVSPAAEVRWVYRGI